MGRLTAKVVNLTSPPLGFCRGNIQSEERRDQFRIPVGIRPCQHSSDGLLVVNTPYLAVSASTFSMSEGRALSPSISIAIERPVEFIVVMPRLIKIRLRSSLLL